MIFTHVSRGFFYFFDRCFGGFDGLAENLQNYLPGFLILKESLFYQHGITMITGKTNTLKPYGQNIPFLPASISIMLGAKRKTEILLLKPWLQISMQFLASEKMEHHSNIRYLKNKRNMARHKEYHQ